MAPDAERKIAHRIREMELTEVPWNRDAVWNRVQEESFTKASDRKYWYYAAAAVLLLIVTTYVFFNLPANKPQEKVVNASKPAALTPPEDQDIDQAAREVVPRSHHSGPLAEVKKEQKETKENVIESNNQALPSDDVEEVIPEFEIADVIFEIPEELPDIHTEETTVEKIRPIVGVILPESSSHTAEVSKKRRRLRTLVPADPLPWEEDPKKALVFARRK